MSLFLIADWQKQLIFKLKILIVSNYSKKEHLFAKQKSTCNYKMLINTFFNEQVQPLANIQLAHQQKTLD